MTARAVLAVVTLPRWSRARPCRRPPETLGQDYEQRAGLADYLKLGYVPNTRSSSISDVHNGVSATLEYVWLAPQNERGLIDALGGDQKANARLDEFLTRNNAGPNQPYYWAGNEVKRCTATSPAVNPATTTSAH